VVVTLTVVDPLNMLLILLGPNDFGGDGFDSFGGGADWTGGGGGDKLPEVRSSSASNGGGPDEDPSTTMPTCPQGQLPFFNGSKWECKASGPTQGNTPAPTTPAPTAPPGGGGDTGEGSKTHPTALGDPEQIATWLYNNIDSTKSMDQWRAWAKNGIGKGAGQLDPSCPSYQPFHTSKNVNGGDASACVDHPDACPPGTGAWGQNDCTPQGAGGGGGNGGGNGGGGGGGAPAPAPTAPVVPKVTNYDPRKFTYGNTWGEQNQAGGPQTQNAPQTGGPDPKSGALGGAGTVGNCPPGQVVNPCLQPPCPCGPASAATGSGIQFAGSDPGRAMPGSSTGTSSGMLLTSNRSLNI